MALLYHLATTRVPHQDFKSESGRVGASVQSCPFVSTERCSFEESTCSRYGTLCEGAKCVSDYCRGNSSTRGWNNEEYQGLLLVKS